MNRARTIARLMRDSTEKARHARGELSYMKPTFYYNAGPLYYLKTPGVPVNGWFAAEGGPAMLLDGHISNHLMRYVDLAKQDVRFADYAAEAETFIDTVQAALGDWQNNWIENRFTAGNPVVGAYYYPQSRAAFSAGDQKGTGTYSGPQAANHHATILSAGLRLNHYRPSAGVDYRDRASKYIQVFKTYALQANGAYLWQYEPTGRDLSNDKKPEDVSHGHMDLDFMILAYKSGVPNVTLADLTMFSRSFDAYAVPSSPGDLHFYLYDYVTPAGVVVGREPANFSSVKGVNDAAAGYGWLDLVEYDAAIMPKVLSMYAKNVQSVDEHGMIGWANIMSWRARLPAAP
jgi:hypothetical protein